MEAICIVIEGLASVIRGKPEDERNRKIVLVTGWGKRYFNDLQRKKSSSPAWRVVTNRRYKILAVIHRDENNSHLIKVEVRSWRK